MEICRHWFLRGRSIWAPVPVLEAELELPASDPLRAVPVSRLREHLPAACRVPDTLNDIAIARLVLDLMLDFQTQAGCVVDFGDVHPGAAEGLVQVVVAYEEEVVARASLEAAIAWCNALAGNEPFDRESCLQSLRNLAQENALGPSTRCLVAAARRRGIPTRRLGSGSLIQLGYGVHQRRVWTAETDAVSSIAESIAQDKELTRALLSNVGVPVPYGRVVHSAEDAWKAAEALGLPVVVKPRYGNQGRGVTTDLRTAEQVEAAYAAARLESEHILVEQHIEGEDYRLLVVGDRVVAAARREPAHVIGDGRSTITELVAAVNADPRRTPGHATSLSPIPLDEVSLQVLADQGQTPDTVPPAGARILVRRNANLSTGGTATDVTDEMHPEVAAQAVAAARVVGLDVAGVDVVASRLDRPLGEQRGAIVEVNAGPGLRMHLEPSHGTPRDVGAAIVDMLVPEGGPYRIPIVAVTGVNGKTTTTRVIAHLFRSAEKYVGMASTDGLYLEDRRISAHDCSGPRSARAILLNPRVEVAVLETARGGILREGLGFDQCDVAVVTNIGAGDHLGLRGVQTLADLARVKRTVVEAVAPTGVAVLNAADPLVAGMAPNSPGHVMFFAVDEKNPTLAEHRERGGRAVFVRDGWAMLASGADEERLIELARVPLTHGGRIGFHVENVLAAIAACTSVGMPAATIRAGLESFHGYQGSPGRFNVFESPSGMVVVDYAHNASALAAVVDALAPLGPLRRTLVFSGFNRRDVDVREMGEIAGQAFDRVILYTDWGNHDRQDGELNALFREGLARGSRATEVIERKTEREALEAAIARLTAGEVAVLGVENVEESLAFVCNRLPV